MSHPRHYSAEDCERDEAQAQERATMNHTPEPWEVRQHGTNLGIGAGHSLLAHWLAEDNEKGDKCRANAARIVACVNGCAGLNPAAFRACIDALRAMLDEHADCKGCEASDIAFKALTLAEQP